MFFIIYIVLFHIFFTNLILFLASHRQILWLIILTIQKKNISDTFKSLLWFKSSSWVPWTLVRVSLPSKFCRNCRFKQASTERLGPPWSSVHLGPPLIGHDLVEFLGPPSASVLLADRPRSASVLWAFGRSQNHWSAVLSVRRMWDRPRSTVLVRRCLDSNLF